MDILSISLCGARICFSTIHVQFFDFFFVLLDWYDNDKNTVLTLPGIYIFHIWSFCAGRKTSTIGLFELCIIIICWIFAHILKSLVETCKVFCVHVHAQKFLIVILDNKVFQRWIICAYTVNSEIFARV